MELADVVKPVDTQRSGRCERKLMRVRISPSALSPLSTLL